MEAIGMTMILIKFIVGGLVITTVTVLANRLGGKVGGVLSGFPAIFMTVFVLEAWGHGGHTNSLLITMVTASLGAIVANLAMVLAAPRTLARLPFHYAVMAMLGIWATMSTLSAVIIPS
jgi:hypothetical protein